MRFPGNRELGKLSPCHCLCRRIRHLFFMSLYKEDLDKAQCACGMPGCEGGLYIKAKCHPDLPPEAYYFDSELRITCAVCKQPVVVIRVASRRAETPKVA
jgi:hypothetical protein